MAYSWSTMFRQFNTKVHSRNFAAHMPLRVMLDLVTPPPGGAWQEGIQLALVFNFMGRDDVSQIMNPIVQGFLQNFRREGSAAGQWKELADWTQEERLQMLREADYYAGQMGMSGRSGFVPGFSATYPILQRTGEYKQTWVDTSDPEHGRDDMADGAASRIIMEGSEHRHAEELSVGNPTKRLEGRPVHFVDDMYSQAMKARIDMVLTKYVQTVHP